MKILVACEFSGRVREAFRQRGHDAWSCDLEPAEDGSAYHFEQDVTEVLYGYAWDLVIACPPCTDLASSGARWWPEKRADGRQQRAVEFVLSLWAARMNRPMALENPVGYLSTAWRKPDQIIQPWQYGHGEVKTTCLWLRGLPLLKPTQVVQGREQRVWRMPESSNRARERSRTYQGVADAMATQWG